MATRATKLKGPRPASAGYLELVGRHPLRPIRTEAELTRAIATMDGLIDRGDLDRDERDYQVVLAGLIRQYEMDHHPMPPVTGPAMVRHLIEARGVTQAAVAAGIGVAPSAFSEMLAGRRRIGTDHVVALARFFGVGPAVFLPE